MCTALTGLLLAAGLGNPTSGQEGDSAPQRDARWEKAPPLWVEENWDVRKLEHLLNRAAFGASQEDLARWTEKGPRFAIERLLRDRGPEEPFLNEVVQLDREAMKGLKGEARRLAIKRMRSRNRNLFQSYLASWIDDMLGGDSPLRERMALFWHNLFTSSITEVQRAHLMIQQSLMFRDRALGSYSDLLRDILRDPAMLIYLDNNSNEKGHPNENLAREVMELFSLGVGNYSEDDVLNAARALTGRGTDSEYEYKFNPRKHDFDEKVILGEEGRLDADDLVDILIAQPACSRYITGRLIEYFEGYPPSEERLETYARILRRHDYQVRPVLRRLFMDPAFYREEVLGARVGSPVDFLVGSCRRLDIEPPASFLAIGSSLAGQTLLDPPSVKGWDGGEAWINTSTLMVRGNLAGLLLGTLYEDFDTQAEAEGPGRQRLGAPRDRIVDDDVFVVMDQMQLEVDGTDRHKGKDARSGLDRMMRLISKAGYRPRMHLTARLLRRGVEGEAGVVEAMLEDLLAIEPPAETRALVSEYLKNELEARKIRPAALLESGSESERLLRDLAHLILSLPEANLG